MSRAAVVLAVLALTGCGPELGPCDPVAARRVVYDQTGSPAYEGQALVVSSCGSGGFCHAPDAVGADREGAPTGLDYDVRLAEDGEPGTDRLGPNQRDVVEDRYAIWHAVASGQMPPGSAGERVVASAPTYARHDVETDEVTALPGLDTDEGREVLRNWLSCGAPVVERSQDDMLVTVGDRVARRDLAPPEPRWPDIYARLIEPQCATPACHGADADGELDLRGEAEALDALLGVPAAGDPCATTGGAPRLVSNDPDGSLLVHKLEGVDAAGTTVCGDRMPDIGASVDPRWIAAVREWIANGAHP